MVTKLRTTADEDVRRECLFWWCDTQGSRIGKREERVRAKFGDEMMMMIHEEEGLPLLDGGWCGRAAAGPRALG
jgi:hypothetical protein